MNIIIESPHFTVNSLLEEYVTKKVSKLSHYNERILKAEVLLKLDTSDTEDNKICEIKVTAPGKNMFAECKCSTFEDAISDVTRSLEKQLKKQKAKFHQGTEKLTAADLDEEQEEI